MSKLTTVFNEGHERIERLSAMLERLSAQHGMSTDEIVTIFSKRSQRVLIPASLFSLDLSPLTCIVAYLHHVLELNQTQVAKLLDRDHTTIWTTLSKFTMDVHDFRERVANLPMRYTLPLERFANRDLSILEHVCTSLKALGLSYRLIGELLSKNERTVWTCVSRAKKKLG